MYYCYLNTPVGELLLAGEDNALCLIGFPEGSMRREPEADWIHSDKPFTETMQQLTGYFNGKRHTFNLKLRPGGTQFQLSVLAELQRIPFGVTASYGEIAARIGKPKAARAVGAANGRNPIPIIIPCHRVIGSDGTMTGFGGGIPMKKALLRLEAENSQQSRHTR